MTAGLFITPANTSLCEPPERKAPRGSSGCRKPGKTLPGRQGEMRHWCLMAIDALPYQMETINELFSLLYAGRREKGTEQGWANLKQCRRLDACLGQTPINSFGPMGEARRAHRISTGTGRSHPRSSGELQGLLA